MSLSSVPAGGMRTKNAVFHDQWFKTKMCPHWPKGTCFRGDTCCYAHSEHELREAPTLWKTKLCQAWLAGTCPYPTQQCKFAHGEADLWCTGDYFKTDICKYWRHGRCTAGELCRHAHGYAELRPRNYRLTELERRIERLRRQGFPKTDSMETSSIHSPPPKPIRGAEGVNPPHNIFATGASASSELIGGASPTSPPCLMVMRHSPEDQSGAGALQTHPHDADRFFGISTQGTSDSISTMSGCASSASAVGSAGGPPLPPREVSQQSQEAARSDKAESIALQPPPPPPLPQGSQVGHGGDQSPQTPISAAISAFTALPQTMQPMSYTGGVSTSSSSSSASTEAQPPITAAPLTPLTALVQAELFRAWMPLLPPAASHSPQQQPQSLPHTASQLSTNTTAYDASTTNLVGQTTLQPQPIQTAGYATTATGQLTPVYFTPLISGTATPIHGAATPTAVTSPQHQAVVMYSFPTNSGNRGTLSPVMTAATAGPQSTMSASPVNPTMLSASQLVADPNSQTVAIQSSPQQQPYTILSGDGTTTTNTMPSSTVNSAGATSFATSPQTTSYPGSPPVAYYYSGATPSVITTMPSSPGISVALPPDASSPRTSAPLSPTHGPSTIPPTASGAVSYCPQSPPVASGSAYYSSAIASPSFTPATPIYPAAYSSPSLTPATSVYPPAYSSPSLTPATSVYPPAYSSPSLTAASTSIYPTTTTTTTISSPPLTPTTTTSVYPGAAYSSPSLTPAATSIYPAAITSPSITPTSPRTVTSPSLGPLYASSTASPTLGPIYPGAMASPVSRVGSQGQTGAASGMATSFKAIGTSLSNAPWMLISAVAPGSPRSSPTAAIPQQQPCQLILPPPALGNSNENPSPTGPPSSSSSSSSSATTTEDSSASTATSTPPSATAVA